MNANYSIIFEGDLALVLRDLGPWNKHLTITNDAQFVISQLELDGMLENDQRVFYIDSDGRLDELKYELRAGSSYFTGFAAGPKDRIIELNEQHFVGICDYPVAGDQAVIS